MMILDFYCPKCYSVMESRYENEEETLIEATCRHHRETLVFHLKQVPRPESELREILARVGAEDLLEDAG